MKDFIVVINILSHPAVLFGVYLDSEKYKYNQFRNTKRLATNKIIKEKRQ